jgi:signal transduction histidine kinase
MVAVVAAMTAGPHVSGLMLAVMLALSLVALQRHPGLPWTAPVVLAAGYGVAAWMLWRWPAQLLEALRARRDAAAASILVRRRLVATLFHDLANPLAVILSEAAGQARGDDDAETLALARSMTRRMQATLAAALGGRVAPRRVEAGRLCDELEALFRERLGQKRLALRVAGPRGAGLLADEALLRDSVLANLLSNALKFSPEGSTIELTVGAQAGQVSFVVEDRGPGMPPEVLAALRRGGQAPSRPGTRGEAGSGFGLMLARDYLTAMGGGLELTPRDGGGLSARIWLRAA